MDITSKLRQTKIPRILLTREMSGLSCEQKSRATLIHAPLLKFKYFQTPVPRHITAMIATSHRGITGAVATPDQKKMPLYVVGSRAAEIAKSMQFTNILGPFSNVKTLYKSLDPCDHYAYLRGAHITQNLQQSCPQIQIIDVTTYHALRSETLPAPAIAALQDHDPLYVPLASQRSGMIFLDLCRQYNADLASLTLLCYSPAIRLVARAHGGISSRLTQSLHLDHLIEVCNE